jgi:hypothetical protein
MEILMRLSAATGENWLVSGARRWWHGFARERLYRWSLGQPVKKCDTLPCISVRGNFSARPESILIKQSLDRALADIGGPPDFIRAIEGMSGQKYRTFINTLVSLTPDARYLEVGSWAGSSATAALYGNTVKALCIDDWSQFGGPRETFFANMERVRSSAVDFQFVEMDFRRVDYTSIGRFNIFLFDGPHKELDQFEGIMVARPALDKSFVLIVDDWNWRSVRLGTFRAIRQGGYSIASAIEIRTTLDNSHATVAGKLSDWHNGYFIAVLKSVGSPARI